MPNLTTIKKRADFFRAARAEFKPARGLVLQARKRADSSGFRVGFTVTKKVGNSVVRNRVRRRLREAARLEMPAIARAEFDYVLIGRKATIDRDFKSLCGDLAYVLGKVHMSHDRAEAAGKGESRRQDG